MLGVKIRWEPFDERCWRRARAGTATLRGSARAIRHLVCICHSLAISILGLRERGRADESDGLPLPLPVPVSVPEPESASAPVQALLLLLLSAFIRLSCKVRPPCARLRSLPLSFLPLQILSPFRHPTPHSPALFSGRPPASLLFYPTQPSSTRFPSSRTSDAPLAPCLTPPSSSQPLLPFRPAHAPYCRGLLFQA